VFRHRVNANRRFLTNVIGVTGTVAKEIAAK
jgi:hypothetical protein